MWGRQKAIIRPASHDIAEIDQKGSGDDRRGEPFAGGQPYGKPGDIGARQRGHKAVVGMRCLAKGVVFGGLLRGVVQKADDGMRFVGKERRKEVAGESEGHGEGRQHAVAHGPERLEIRHHIGADAERCRRPLVAAAQRLAGEASECSGPRSWLTKKLSFWFGFVALCTVLKPRLTRGV